jgi:hypothetical protein
VIEVASRIGGCFLWESLAAMLFRELELKLLRMAIHVVWKITHTFKVGALRKIRLRQGVWRLSAMEVHMVEGFCGSGTW